MYLPDHCHRIADRLMFRQLMLPGYVVAGGIEEEARQKAELSSVIVVARKQKASDIKSAYSQIGMHSLIYLCCPTERDAFFPVSLFAVYFIIALFSV